MLLMTNLVRQTKTNPVTRFCQYNLTTLDFSVGKTLYRAREEVGLSQEELAVLAKISKSYVGTIENMRPHTTSGAPPKPKRDKMIRIIDALNTRLPLEHQLDVNDLLIKVGHAPLDIRTGSKPQNGAEFAQRLADMGFDIQTDFDWEKLGPDALQEIIDDIEAKLIFKTSRLDRNNN